MSCPLCEKRKAKRACPAKQFAICPQCCGSKRLVEIACPDGCVYLHGGQAGAWEGRETERKRDSRRVAPHLSQLEEGQLQLFLLLLVGLVKIRARRHGLDDRLLEQAVATLRKTVETRTKGLLYEHQADDVRAQRLVFELQGLFEAKDEEGQKTAPADSDLLAVLKAIEGCLADTRRETAEPTAFLDTALRLAGRFGAEPSPGRRRLIET